MKHYFVPTNGIQWLTLMLVVAVAVGFLIGFRRLDQTQAEAAQQRAKIIYVQRHQNDALHSILCRGEAFTRRAKPPIETPAQRAAGLRFYRHALKDAHLKPC